MTPTSLVPCARCGKSVRKEDKQITLSIKRGKRMFCSKSCSSLARHEDDRASYVPPTERRCVSCGVVKPIDSFHRNSAKYDGRTNVCRPCRSENERRSRNANPERRSALVKQWRYGITPEEQQALLDSQGGVCGICGCDPPLVIDHCHNTNVVRGLLCNRCNVALGAMGDSVDGLLRALTYLTKHDQQK
jgi:hypothetical protein